MIDADAIVKSLLQSTDEAERERSLEQLVTVHAAPIISQIIQRRSGRRFRQSMESNLLDPEDLQREIILELIVRLRRLMTGVEQRPIRNFRRYVIGVAVNVFNNSLRAKSPARSNLRDNLRDILSRHKRFILWKNVDGKWLCGLAEWGNAETVADVTAARGKIDEASGRLINQRRSGSGKSRILGADFITSLLVQINQPLWLDDLVEIVSSLLNIRDQKIESLDQNEWISERHAVGRIGPDAELLGRELLLQFWDELRQLPRTQRDAISLGFYDGKGEDLFSLLIGEGVATPEQIRREFELSEDEFYALWMRLPIRDMGVLAERLGATRTQLRKWRFLGWKRIRSVFL